MQLEVNSKNSNSLFFLLLLLYILSVIINWSILPLDGEEPRRALVSIEMLESGNYIMPTVFGWPYYNKPPIYNWILSFFYGCLRHQNRMVGATALSYFSIIMGILSLPVFQEIFSEQYCCFFRSFFTYGFWSVFLCAGDRRRDWYFL